MAIEHVALPGGLAEISIRLDKEETGDKMDSRNYSEKVTG